MSAVEKQGGNRVAKTPKPRWQLDFSSRFVKILNEMVFLFQSWRIKYIFLLYTITGLIKTSNCRHPLASVQQGAHWCTPMPPERRTLT